MKKIIAGFIALVSFSQIQCGNVQWSFPPTQLSASNFNASDPHLAIDSSGNVVAVWVENNLVKASSHHINMSWSSEVSISATGASSPRVVSDANGNATAVWLESGVVKAATKTLNGNWSSSTALSSSGASTPTLAVDSAGDVVAVWARSNNIESSTKLFGGSWQTHVTITSSGATLPCVAIGGSGSNTTVIAIWQGTSGTTNVAYGATKTISGSWSAQQVISNTAHQAANVHGAVDANGNAVAIWYQYDATGNLYSNVAVSATTKPFGGSWNATPQVISSAGIRNPATLVARVAYDSLGNAIALWNTSFDDATYNIESAILPVRGQWSNLTDIVTSNLFANGADFAVTSFGDVLATYMFYNGASFLVNSAETEINAVSQNSWSVPISLSSATSNGSPKVAATVTGNTINAAAVWIAYNGTHNLIVASTGAKSLVLPATSLSVTRSSVNYGVFTEFYNTLSWTASTDPSVVGYLIFRNGVLVQQVDSSITQIRDDNRVQNDSVIYGVVAINAQGGQSNMATVSSP